MMMSVNENVPIDTIVGEVQALDADEDRNAQIGYVITGTEIYKENKKSGFKIGILILNFLQFSFYRLTDGNDENLFEIIDADDESSTGVIRVVGLIDREKKSHALLTVKCFKKRDVPRVLHKKYNKTVGLQPLYVEI